MIGWLIIVPLSICAAARAARLEESSSLLLLASGLTPLLGLPALVALGIGLRQRRPALAIVSAATAAAHLYSALSGLGAPVRAPSPAGTLPALRLFTANVHHANRDLGGIGQEIRAAAPDLVALQEVDPDGAAGLQLSGVLAAFPYAVTELRKGASGIGLWSRFPIAGGQVRDVHGMVVIKATILLGAHRLRLYTIHTVAPLGDDRARWQAQLLWVNEEIRRERGSLVVAGDFNATRYHSSFRRLLSDRLADAHERRGRGWAATWPRDRWPLPPLLRLDHVLVSPDIGVRSVKEGLGQGSDHRPIIAELVLLSGAAAFGRLERMDRSCEVTHLLGELHAPPQSERGPTVNGSLAEIEFLLRKVRFEPLARRPMFELMNYPVAPPAGCTGSAGGCPALGGRISGARQCFATR